MNHANLPVNQDIHIVSVVVTVILFEVIVERGVWSIPVKQEDESIFGVLALGEFSLLLIQKQGEEHKVV